MPRGMAKKKKKNIQSLIKANQAAKRIVTTQMGEFGIPLAQIRWQTLENVYDKNWVRNP